jgi:hypothetical protein
MTKSRSQRKRRAMTAGATDSRLVTEWTATVSAARAMARRPPNR